MDLVGDLVPLRLEGRSVSMILRVLEAAVGDDRIYQVNRVELLNLHAHVERCVDAGRRMGGPVRARFTSEQLDLLELVLDDCVARWGNLRSMARERGVAFRTVNAVRKARRERSV